MTYQVEVNALIGFADEKEAEFTAEVLRRVVGKRSSVRLLSRRSGIMVPVPDVEKFDPRKATRGGQEADALAGGIARKLNQALKTDAITPARVLDESIRTWVVDYAAILTQVKALNIEGAETVFREVVATALADNALRGIK